jgi:hypothetical protein
VTSLSKNVWNTVEINMTINQGTGGSVSGSGQISINGTMANSPCLGAFLNTTTPNVVVGLEGTSASFGWSGYFDNITAAVKR